MGCDFSVSVILNFPIKLLFEPNSFGGKGLLFTWNCLLLSLSLFPRKYGGATGVIFSMTHPTVLPGHTVPVPHLLVRGR